MKTAKTMALVAAVAALPAAAQAAGADEAEQGTGLELRLELQNLVVFLDDTDFDRSPPLYDENGQTSGVAATVFRPDATWRITEHLRIRYEIELGLNYWSKNNPDQQEPIAGDLFVLKHRQIYGEGELADGRLGFRAGYFHLRDATGLFLSHWIGAAQAWWTWDGDGRVGLFAGQVPDQTYEGLLVTENNFQRDILVFGAFARLRLADGVRLDAGLHNLYDTHLVEQTRWRVCPSLHLELGDGRVRGFVDAALQAGRSEGVALDGGAQTALAWAAQGHLVAEFAPVTLELNVLALGPDDAHQGNDTSHAFLYSGKSRSATLLFTEDEVRDWYTNLDERMSGFQGGFFENRAGLLVADVKASWRVCDWFRPALVVGAATVLQPDNALGHVFAGVEGDLMLVFRLSEHLEAHLVAGGILPGRAAAAKINRISPDATDPLGLVELSLRIRG